jgi:hypothetical protein
VVGDAAIEEEAVEGAASSPATGKEADAEAAVHTSPLPASSCT